MAKMLKRFKKMLAATLGSHSELDLYTVQLYFLGRTSRYLQSFGMLSVYDSSPSENGMWWEAATRGHFCTERKVWVKKEQPHKRKEMLEEPGLYIVQDVKLQ